MRRMLEKNVREVAKVGERKLGATLTRNQYGLFCKESSVMPTKR
jgi:hypothetical protein